MKNSLTNRRINENNKIAKKKTNTKYEERNGKLRRTY